MLTKQQIGMKRYFESLSPKGLRMCTLCKEQKEDDEFSRSRLNKFSNTGSCNACRKKMDTRYYKKNRERILDYFQKHGKLPYVREINHIAVSKHRFGLNRYKVIRPETECSHCNITQEEHLEKYGFSLSIHHNDGWGRKAQRLKIKPNNNLDNLSFLCSPCHTREHNRLRDYTGNGRKVWETRRRRYGVTGIPAVS